MYSLKYWTLQIWTHCEMCFTCSYFSPLMLITTKLDPWNWTNQDSQSVLYGKKLNVASQPCLNQLILPSNYVFLDVSCLKKLKYTTLPLKKWQLIFRKKLCVYFSATQVSKHFLLLKMYVWSQSCCLWEQVPLLF